MNRITRQNSNTKTKSRNITTATTRVTCKKTNSSQRKLSTLIRRNHTKQHSQSSLLSPKSLIKHKSILSFSTATVADPLTTTPPPTTPTTSTTSINTATGATAPSTTVHSPQQPQQVSKLIEHVFFRVDVTNKLFFNQIQVSFPDHTPTGIVQESAKALQIALKDRPECQNYSQQRLPPPEFNQFGSNWNRYEWTIRQREIDGALDPLLIQTILLDHFHNNLNAKYISCNSSTKFNHESVTHVLQFPVDVLDYIGTYHDTIYDQDGCSV